MADNWPLMRINMFDIMAADVV